MANRRENLNKKRARVSWFRAKSEELRKKIKTFLEDHDVFINRHGYIEEGKNKEFLIKLRKIASEKGIDFSISFPK